VDEESFYVPKEVQSYEDPYHDFVGKVLQVLLNAKTKKDNHFAKSNLYTYPELTTRCL
jgi:hypothetical protein